MKRIMQALAATVAAGTLLMLGGCIPIATPQQQAEIAATTPVCHGKKQCEAAWAAARNWVTSNCGMKIETYTDSFLQTFNSKDSASVDLACSVSKTPVPSGGYSINATMGCNNFLGCQPDATKSMLRFNKYVEGELKQFPAG